MGADAGDRRGQPRRGRLAAAERPIGAAEQQPVIGGPARVVIVPPRVPEHHVGEAQLAPRPRVERRRRHDVGVGHLEAAGERAELAGRVAGRDHHLPRLDDAVARCGPGRRRGRPRCAAPATARRCGRRAAPLRRRPRRRRGTDRSGRCRASGCRRGPGGRPRRARRAASATSRRSRPAAARRTRRAGHRRRRPRSCSRRYRAVATDPAGSSRASSAISSRAASWLTRQRCRAVFAP